MSELTDTELAEAVDWPAGFVEEILTLLDRIEIEEDASLAGQRHAIAEKHGLTVEIWELVSGELN